MTRRNNREQLIDSASLRRYLSIVRGNPSCTVEQAIQEVLYSEEWRDAVDVSEWREYYESLQPEARQQLISEVLTKSKMYLARKAR